MQYRLVLGLTLILGAVAITGAGCSLTNQQSTPATQSAGTTDKQIMDEKENTAMAEKAKMGATNKEGAAEEKEVMENVRAGMYKDYSPTALAEATKNGGKAVLFFWAAWCPNCKTANAELLANINKIPNNVTVLKTNYDNEKSLKTKYGVTYQHTFVQVDAQGNQITKWNGGGISDLLANIK